MAAVSGGVRAVGVTTGATIGVTRWNESAGSTELLYQKRELGYLGMSDVRIWPIGMVLRCCFCGCYNMEYRKRSEWAHPDNPVWDSMFTHVVHRTDGTRSLPLCAQCSIRKCPWRDSRFERIMPVEMGSEFAIMLECLLLGVQSV